MRKRKNIITDGDSDSDFESDYPELKKCDKKITKEFCRIRDIVEKSEPNIIEILSLTILDKDKTELFELFEIYANKEDLSLNKLDLKKQIIKKIEQSKFKYEQYMKYSQNEHKNFEDEMRMLQSYDENEDMKYKILSLNCSQPNKKIIFNQYQRMLELSSYDEELPKLKNWLKWAMELPYNNCKSVKYSKNSLTTFLQCVRKKMDEELYGMENAKEQILLFLNSRILNPNMQKCSVGLLGPPGCGKTSIVRLLAEVLEYPLEQISLGGIQSPNFLKGHQYTYIGSEPGEIVKAVCKMGVKNGIIFFDEYDKVSENKDVCSALLHITDSSQNNKFVDNFLSGLDIDLSSIWFFYSMNAKPLDDALSDRVYYIELDGYSQTDKFYIVRDYLLKKAHSNLGWKDKSLTISDDGILYLVQTVSPPITKGIRSLEHSIISICNRVNFLINHQDSKGKLKIRTTFDISKKITFPFCLDKEMVEMLLDK